MAEKITNSGVSKEAYDRLLREEKWLDACRSHYGNTLESSLPLAFAENVQPDETIAVIRCFVSLVNRGITPPAHILAAVAKGFGQYLTVGNNAIAKNKEPINLDRAFKLSPKQSVGHPLKHEKEKGRKGRFVYEMWAARKMAEQETGKRVSKNEAFARVNVKYKTESYKEDAMLKEYTKLKADEVFGDAFEVLEEVRRAASVLSEKNLQVVEEIITKL